MWIALLKKKEVTDATIPRLLAVGAVAGCFVACNPQADTSAEGRPAEAGGETEAGEQAPAEATAAVENPSPAEEQQEEAYEFVPPKELAFEVQDFYYNGAVAADGVKPNGGEVGKLLCAGKAVELASPEFEDGYIVTKDFGKIKVRFSSSLTSEGFAVFLTPTQKGALRKFCSA
jgi:hypothetical protein